MLPNHDECCGCSACASICPLNCIRMEEDVEGFDYPSIDSDRCVNCKKCESVCPILHHSNKGSTQTYTLVAQNSNEIIRSISSAGGIVGAILEHIFSNNGVGYAVGFDKGNNVVYFRVTSISECIEHKVFSSKYVAARFDDTFASVKHDLKNGKLVCFIGLPCQVEGLIGYLGKIYSNLITIDLTCYGCPSRKLYRKYLDYIELKYKTAISDVRFRDKSYGYSAPTMAVELSGGKVLSQNSVIKSYLRAYFANMSIRMCCYSCKFKGVNRSSDLTIGDCKNIRSFVPKFDDDLGTTVIYIHSDVGKRIIKELEGHINTAPVELEKVVSTCGRKMMECAPINTNRNSFFAEIDTLTYPQLIKKYCPPNLSEYIANIIKELILLLHLNNTSILRRLKHR